MKRHTTLIKRMRLSIGTDNRDHILKDVDSLTLEKYIDELAGAAVEGVLRCKTEKDVWSAVEVCASEASCPHLLRTARGVLQVISAFHRRFPTMFTPSVVSGLLAVLAPPSRAALASLTPEQREKEDATRVSRQRPALRVCSELALVGILTDGSKRSGGETIMKTLRDLVRTKLVFSRRISDTRPSYPTIPPSRLYLSFPLS